MDDDAARPTQRQRRVRVWRAVLGVTGLALAALLLFWDWNWFKGPIERRVTAATGREFRIDGNLDVDLGRIVVVRVENLWLANVAWSLTPEMAKADLLRFEVPFWPLLRGERILRRVDIVRPALLLERNHRSTANWQFRKRGQAAGTGPGWSFGELRVHDGRLDVRDLPLDTHLQLTIDSAKPEPGAESVRLLARGSGRYRGHPFQLDGWADSPVALLGRADAAYRVDFSARAGATRARAYGALRVPLDPAAFTVHAELRGDDLGDLYALVGLAVPETPPYSIRGLFERKGRVLSLRDLEGTIGDSDVAGSVAVDLSGAKPSLKGDLVSTHLDFDDVGVAFGLPPSVAEGESASPAQRAEAKERAAGTRLLPHKEFNLRKLGSMNADVHIRADDVDAGKWPIQSVTTRVHLRDGMLRLDPLQIGFADGGVGGAMQLDASRDPIDAAFGLKVAAVDLEKVFPNMQPPNVGRINGNVDLRGQGNSVAAMLATADGEVQLGMGQGRFSNLLLELAGLDVAETLKFLLGKDKTVKLRCAYGDFAVAQGVVTTRSMVFDTSDTVMFGEGKVNLGEEALALELRPEPKDVSPLSLRGPLKVGGTFKEPKFRPEGKALALRAAAAAALYAITPPAALLALIETGPGENVDCYQGGKPSAGKDKAKDTKGKDISVKDAGRQPDDSMAGDEAVAGAKNEDGNPKRKPGPPGKTPVTGSSTPPQ
ncbi:MAG TPA: AsmA family protein [Steroidobacteraceae bacterium]|nr:AsmA family protein [Steroidobacteraceae bacterium]